VSGLESLGHALAFAVGAGINLYATVLVLGLAARYDWVDVPGTLEPVGSAWVIGGAAVLYLLEFLADKIPWVDSLWDAIHTLVRPIGASTHAAKAGTRLAVNASPEPASNIAVSLLEDGFVVGLVLLLLTHPLLGLALAVAALVSVLLLLAVLFRLVMRRRRRRESTIP
jgi:hypothetical protein